MSVRISPRLLVAALVLAATGPAAIAQTAVTWTQGVTGNWNNTGNWTGLIPPDLFPNNGANTYTVTIPGVAGQANTTTLIFDNTTIVGNTLTTSGLTLSSALNAAGNNSAELVLGSGVTLNAGNLTNFSGTTLSGGRYFLDGTLRFNGANVQTLASGTTLIMNGPAAALLNQVNNANALSGFKTNNGTFDIRNGFNFSAASGWVNTGTVSVSEGSTFSAAGAFTNSGTLLASGVSGTGTVTVTGVTMANAGGTLNAGNNGVINVVSSAITGGTLTTSGNGRITFNNSGNNLLTATTLSGTADLATSLGAVRVVNGLTYGAGGVFNVNNGSVVVFQGDNMVSGTGSVVLGSTGSNKVAVDGNLANVVFGSGVTIRGHSGTIGAQHFIGTTGSMITNNGLISADMAGGTIDITQATVSNNNILEAKNGGTLRLLSNVSNSASGQINATNNGVVRINGVTVTGGVLNTSTGGRITASNNVNNALDNVTLGGTLDLATSASATRVVNNLGLNAGLVSIDNGSVLAFTGNSSTSGVGRIVFGATGSNQVALDGNNSTLILGGGTIISGQNGSIGAQRFSGTTGSTVVNNGIISADVAGGTISLQQAAFNNNNILEARGGALNVQSAVTNSAAGQVNAFNNGVVTLNGATINGGSINTGSGGRFTAANLASNFVNDVTVSGGIDLATSLGSIRVTGASGMTLSGGATINIDKGSTLAFQGAQSLAGTGSVVFGSSASNRVAVDQDGSTLTIGAGATIRGHTGSVGAQLYVGTSNSGVINNGTISADASGGTISLQQAGFTNNNVLEARNGGTLNIGTSVTSSASGQINAHDNGIVRLSGTTIAGGSVNTSNGGAFRATNSSANFMNNVTVNGDVDLATAVSSVRVTGGMTLGANGVVSVNSNSAFVFNGTSTLGGTGAVLFGSSGAGNRIGLDNANATLTIGQGVTVHGVSGTIGNQVYVGTTNSHLINNGTINSDGGGLITIAAGSLADVTNNGTLRAQNGTLTNGLQVTGTGTLQVDATGIMNMAGVGSNVQDKLLMGAAGATLNTNNRNITINKDYTNVGAGSGNSFNRRAGINGTGMILAGGDAAQALSGANVTNGATANATLTIGNVRVGTTNFDYNVVNTGSTGPDLRGAIQTSVNGGNISDARLSGSGVTASNYGPAPTGGSYGPLNVGFTALSAGALAPLGGQAVNLRSNFDNIADQKLNIVLAQNAAAYNLALGNASTPVILGNTRVGGTLAGNISVTNAAPAGSFSEKLDATFGANTGNVSNNGGAISLLAANSTNNTSMGVALSTATSGAKTGTATLNYVSNGTGTSGLANLSVGSQAVTVNGNVFQAAAGQLNSPALNFGTVQVGQSVSQVLSVTNSATGAAGFVEDLNASFGSKSGTGTSLFSGSGSINGLLAGSTNNSAMTVSVNTAAAGSINGAIDVNYFSAGAVNGVSNGLGLLAVGSSPFGVSGSIQAVANVVNQASPLINNAPINLGNVRINSASPTGMVSVTNQATVAPQAALNATITGNAAITASGAFNLLNPGATDASSLLVGMNTSTAGLKNGSATVGFVSDATNIGNCAPNCQLTLASQNVAVNGAVYRLANPTVSSTPINLVARVGDVAPTASIGITNTSPDAFTERLDASFNGSAPSGFATSGSVVGLAAQGNSSALTVGLNTATAGVFSGNANINLTSSGAGTTNAADFALGQGSAALNGKVYAKAVGQLNANAVDFGIVHVGDALGLTNVSVTNAAAAAALNDMLTGDITGGNAAFAVAGTLGSGLAAGSTNSSSLTVGLNTANAGTFTGTGAVNFKSHNADMTDLTLGSSNVSFSATVNNYADASFTKSAGLGAFNFTNGGWVLDFGTIQLGSSNIFATLGVQNSAGGPADELNGNFSFGNGSGFGFSGFNMFTGIGAGSVFGNLGVMLNTATLGMFSQTVSLDWFGSNASGYAGSTSNLQLTVLGNVTGVVTPPTTVPEPSTLVLIMGGLAGLAWARRRRATRR